MTDTTPTPGERLDTKLAEVRETLDGLRADLGAQAADKIDALSVKLDELQAAWDERDIADGTDDEGAAGT